MGEEGETSTPIITRKEPHSLDSRRKTGIYDFDTFQQIFRDIPGIALPFSSRHTLRMRIKDDFDMQRLKLKKELSKTCRTIALSLDVWTSRNHLPIIGMIGHWVTNNFEYRERVLDFREIYGTHSGENLSAAVETTLAELGLERKLITITGDNASNNQTVASELFYCLSEKLDLQEDSNDSVLLYRGLDSYIRCLAHILNLIVKDILRVLKSGNVEEASAACDNLRDGKSIGTQTALARLRILALWIDRTPQRRQKWNEVCKIILNMTQQISKFFGLQKELPEFTTQDWLRVTQIHKVLSKFNELTLFLSKRGPQISVAIPIYYKLHDFLHDASEFKGEFAGFDRDIGLAVTEGIKKYNKYYSLMDDSDVYYTALVLDPRVKGNLILQELRENNSGESILQTVRQNLHRQYQFVVQPGLSIEFGQDSVAEDENDVESRMLRRLQPRGKTSSPVSDIDMYFDSPATQTGFAIGGVLVKKVERLFSAGRDLLGVRRHSMKADTMRMLMLMGDMYDN
ncbi:ribonuclease H-like domain-containing protein [Lipomyces kononenkoae]